MNTETTFARWTSSTPAEFAFLMRCMADHEIRYRARMLGLGIVEAEAFVAKRRYGLRVRKAANLPIARA